jgi:hypothetical protein
MSCCELLLALTLACIAVSHTERRVILDEKPLLLSQEVAEPGVEIFEHLFFNVEKEIIEEVRSCHKKFGCFLVTHFCLCL